MIPDPLAAGAPYPLPQEFPDPLDWPWPFTVVGWWMDALWEFARDTLGKIRDGVEALWKNVWLGLYNWERGLFINLIPEVRRYEYPEGQSWWGFDWIFSRAFRLPFDGISSSLTAARDWLGERVQNVLSTLGLFLARLERIPYEYFRGLVLPLGWIKPEHLEYFPPVDEAWGIGRASQYLWHLALYVFTLQIWDARDKLVAHVTTWSQHLEGIINGIRDNLGLRIDQALAWSLSASQRAGDLLALIPAGLGDTLARIITAVTVDLPRTLGGLAQAVANQIGPLITAAIAGLGDLPARVQQLLRPLLDTIGTALDSFRTDAINRLSGLGTTLVAVTTAVIISIPNAVASIIPTITATLGTLRTTLLSQIQSLGSTLATNITNLGSTLGTNITNLGSSLATSLDQVRTSLGARLSDLDRWLAAQLETIRANLATLPTDLPDLVLGRLRATLDSITSGITGLPQAVWGLISPRLDDLRIALAAIPGQMTAFIGPRLDDLRTAITTIPDQVHRHLEELLSPVTSFLRDLPDSVAAMLDSLADGLERGIAEHFPRPLTSGIVPPIAGGAPVPVALALILAALARFGPILARLLTGMTAGLGLAIGTSFGTTAFQFSARLLIAQVPLIIGPAIAFGAVNKWDFGAMLSELGKGLFTSVRTALEWAGGWLDEGVAALILHFKSLGYLSPVVVGGTPMARDTSLAKIQTMVREMALGLGLFSAVGETIGVWKHLGLGHLSALLWDMTNFRLITGAVMGAITWSAITWPLRYYFNDQFRPMMPPLPDISMMYAKHEIDDATFERWLGFEGFHPDIVDVYKRYIFRDPRLFEIVRLAEIAAPPVTPPPEVVTWLARLKVAIKDPADWWYYYKFGKAGYEDVDIEVLVQVAKMAVARREQTAYFMQTRRLFRDGFITTQRARQLLEDGWVPEEPIGFRLKAMLLEREYEVLSDKRSIILQAMARGLATDGDAYSGLLDLGMDSERAALAIMGRRLGLLPIAREVPPEPLPGGGGFGEE